MAISKKMEIPIYNKLIHHWRDLNYDIEFGPSKEEGILAIEAKYDITLPDDFRTYLLKACPKPHGGEMDENYVSWWPLKDIKTIPEEYEDYEQLKIGGGPEKYLFFADHLVWSWAWAICCELGNEFGRIIWIGDGAIIANSFSDFVEKYIRESPDFVGC